MKVFCENLIRSFAFYLINIHKFIYDVIDAHRKFLISLNQTMNVKNKPYENTHKSYIYLQVLIVKLLIAISVDYTTYSFFIKGSHSHMKNNTEYLDTPVTFERVGILGADFNKLIQWTFYFSRHNNKWV